MSDGAFGLSDLRSYAVVGGNPAKMIRRRFSDEVIAGLQAIQWWNWPVEKVTRHLDAIVSADLEALKRCAET